MRTTALERLDCRRLVPYDPDYHGMLDHDGSLELKVIRVEAGELKVRFRFKSEIKKRDDGQLFGVIEGEALTVIRNPAITEDLFDEETGLSLPENLQKVLEGAFSDDVLLPVSQVSRAMRMPALLLSPVDFSELLGSPRPVREAGEPAEPPEAEKSAATKVG